MIGSKIEQTTKLLDELIQVVCDVIPDTKASTPFTQPSGGIGDLLTMFLNNKMNMGQEHGPKKDEWEILPSDQDPQTLETED